MVDRPAKMKGSRSQAKSDPGLDPQALLLSTDLDASTVARLLSKYGIQDPVKADANLQALAGDPQERRALADIIEELLRAIGETADPDQALNQWDRFVQTGIHRGQLFQYLAQTPKLLHMVCAIFGNSPAMAETMVRDPLLVYWLGEQGVVSRAPTARQYAHALRHTLETFQTWDLKLDAVRRFTRREMLRIGIRDLLRLATVTGTVAALSNLAAVIIQAVYEIVNAKLTQEFGYPAHCNRQGKLKESGFVVLGMGKLGGGELNYSSDVDLLYVYESREGETRPSNGRTALTNESYFERLARDLTAALAQPTQEGSIFRVDLRLRPEGTVGPLAQSLDDALRYYATRGRDWERLALIKAWPIAGDRRVGGEFLRRVRSFVLGDGAGQDSWVTVTVRNLKEQIRTKMRRRGEDDRHVKLGTGGIREIEFIVQALQVRHAPAHPELMERNTLKALRRLGATQVLPPTVVRQLRESYIFLRDVEHKLQMVEELQTHLIPREVDEVAKCAVRLGYPRMATPHQTAEAFLEDYRRHASAVHQVFEQVIDKM